jgi:RNA polymerase sigma-70 factor (ECF subfamily)
MPESGMTGNILLFAGSESVGTAAAAPEAVQPETALVERITAGDERAFGELYKIYAPMVHGIILARVPAEEADDIAQEVFLAAYRNLKTLREAAALGPWLGSIARNRVVEFYRRSRPTEELTDHFSRSDTPRNEANEIMAAIHSLPIAYAETLVLRLVEGMTGPEIAAQTGLTPESVRVNLHRGLKLLRQKLGITE